MKVLSGLSLALALSFGLTACGGSSDADKTPTIPTPDQTPPELSADACYLMQTTLGDITLAIDLTNTPITGQNFKQYVDKSFFDGTLFHRTINNFVIQGGGFTSGLNHKDTDEPIKNEAAVGISNERGTIAMARTQAPDSATSQFFINVLDNPHLDASASSYGYAVFGQVTEGMDVVDQISIVPTTSINGFNDTPVDEILIESISEVSCPAV
ncbi:peptidylprolyl isomerase [Shewanella acanthi]|uniref:peptidylprolyl isomerase n=1 Tax=Shewanella acanthi TaxID=2864212 RepID=UPI001C65FAC5|nr:peptidylprolyl isomerase [Shewanella acanthi]QYJ77896.1 peptidylprolyl isomerase [Shewanella acanthi]